jgi:hypothetical protein
MRTLLTIVIAMLVGGMFGAILMSVRAMAMRARRQREVESAETDEMLKRMDDRLAEREREQATPPPPPPSAAQTQTPPKPSPPQGST